METATVGRKKTKEPDPNRKPVALTIKGDPAWREWVESAAAHSRMSVSAYVDFCLARGAKAEGFPKKPPERLP
jgi:hypothetical protein